jgi:hypothetical protein
MCRIYSTKPWIVLLAFWTIELGRGKFERRIIVLSQIVSSPLKMAFWAVSENPFQIGEELIASVNLVGSITTNTFFRLQVTEQ